MGSWLSFSLYFLSTIWLRKQLFHHQYLKYRVKSVMNQQTCIYTISARHQRFKFICWTKLYTETQCLGVFFFFYLSLRTSPKIASLSGQNSHNRGFSVAFQARITVTEDFHIIKVGYFFVRDQKRRWSGEQVHQRLLKGLRMQLIRNILRETASWKDEHNKSHWEMRWPRATWMECAHVGRLPAL